MHRCKEDHGKQICFINSLENIDYGLDIDDIVLTLSLFDNDMATPEVQRSLDLLQTY